MVGVDTSIENINTYKYEPYQGMRLNAVGDIRITITNEDQLIYPTHSYLFLEREQEPWGCGVVYTKDEVGLVWWITL